MRSILQTQQWAQFKHSQGLEILKVGEIFVHKKSLPLGQNFLYIPEASAQDVSGNHIDELKNLAKQNNSIFLRLELIDRFSDSAQKLLKSFGFVKSFEQVQPKWRQVINLELTRGEILAQMKQKGRYNLRLAQKKQVEIQISNLKSQNYSENLKTFYSLYKQTCDREKLGGRSLEYFTNLVDSFDGSKNRSESTLNGVERVDSFKETDYLGIYIAKYENQPVAAALISFYDGVASYLYGGSSEKYREVMAPYLLHWQIICDAKERSMKIYDLIGRAKPGDEKSSWAGITRFKEQFGGEAIEILGSYDYIAKPMWYQMFKIAEKMRRKSE